MSDKKAFRKEAKRAKTAFFQGKLESASKAKEVFEISKWHRSKGTFRTLLLTDPFHPEDPPAQTPYDK